ncbi:MAG: hypothetical protein AB7N24_23585 [Dehalococcoidia bacterium]
MTRARLSRYSWISLLGLVVGVASALGGLVVAGLFVADNDDALTAGLAWGAIVGVATGGCVTALAHWCWCRGCPRWVAWLTSPGAVLGAPLLASATLNGETGAAVMLVAGLIVLSGITAEITSWALRAGRRTSGCS